MEEKKVIKPWIDIENEKCESFLLKSKLFFYENKTFWFTKLFSTSMDGRDSATLVFLNSLTLIRRHLRLSEKFEHIFVNRTYALSSSKGVKRGCRITLLC